MATQRTLWRSVSLAAAIAVPLIAISAAQPAVAVGTSSPNGPINQSEVLARAQSWVAEQVPYSQTSAWTDSNGSYRQDCSGMVSMSWHVTPSGLGAPTTVSLPSYATQLASLDDLAPGDMIDHSGDHTVLFVGWTDSSHTVANVYEESGAYPGEPALESQITRSYLTRNGFLPYRYHQIVEDMSNPTPPPPTDRIGVLQGGVLLVKQGPLTAGWATESSGGIAKAKVDGDMIGILTASGELYVKEGALDAGWVDEIGGVADFQLDAAAGRIGILRTNGTVAVKDGGLYGSWDEETNNVAELRLSGDMIGVVYTNGVASVKQGTLAASWVDQTNNVTDLELDASTDRIGVLQTGGTVSVKDGGLYGSWDAEIGGAAQLRLSGDYLGVVQNGNAEVKEGPLDASWVPEIGNVADLELNGETGRIGILRTDGTVAVKDGGLYGSWDKETNGVTGFSLTDY